MLLLLAVTLLIGYLWTRQSPDARAKVHYALAYLYLWVKRKCSTPRFNFVSDSKKIEQQGIVSLPEAIQVENPRPLPGDVNAVDSVRFYGVNKHGAAVSVQLDRRHGRVTEASVYLRLPSGEEYQLPSLPDGRVINTDGRRFTAAGLTFQVLEPLRKWRVIFNGYLRKRIRDECIENDSDDVLLVRFNFIWSPIYNYLIFPEDFSIDHMARIASTTPEIKNVGKISEHFPIETLEQCGQLYGTVNIGDDPEIKMLVRGLKKRKHGIFNHDKVHYTVSIEGYLNDGTNFHLFAEDIEDGIPNFVYGYVDLPCNMKLHHFSECQFDFGELIKENRLLKDINIKFTAGQRLYTLHFRSLDAGYSRFSGDNWQTKVTFTLGEVVLNGKRGQGAVEICCPQNLRCPPFNQMSLPLLQEPVVKDCPDLIVTFEDQFCRNSKVVGGKGSSLALMTTLKHVNKNIAVPQGLCITQTAFALYLNEHPDIIENISRIENVAWKRIDGSLSTECEKVVTAIHATQISSRLKLELKEKLLTTFGSNLEDLKFAVRSSAIGEDGDEMSAAGQNETVLGVKGLDHILKSIITCWASQFSFRSIEYKRQNGQLLNGGMGVVVQQMVPADVAGVLFSRDPLSGSLGKMILTSNYGLGESVVSALADPDTITINRSWDDKLSIENKQIGKKTVMITMSDYGTVEEEVPTEESAKCTVSDENALKLARIALFLENCFGTGRDIEWAIKDDVIFLLQSRPVTNENPITEFEAFHEFDTPMKTDEEHFSTANVSEVVPGAASVLATTTVLRVMMAMMQRIASYKAIFHRYDPTVVEGIAVCFGHYLFDQIQTKSWVLEEEKSVRSKAIDIGMYGRVLDDNDVCEKARSRYENPPLKSKIKIISLSLRSMFFGWINIRLVADYCNNCQSPSVGLLTIDEVVESIEAALLNGDKSMEVHQQASFASVFWNLICFSVISGNTDFSQEHYTDFGNLIGAGNGTISGEVPFRLRDLARTIVNEADAVAFCSMSQEDALDWLRNNTSTSGKKFREFLQRHGHRGMHEFDLLYYSWGMAPKMLVKVIQDIARYPAALSVDEKNKEDAIASMKTKLTWTRKQLLSLVLRGAKNAVCQREQTKSWAIKHFDCMRQAYRHLADLMVKGGYLPEADLLFFMSHEEMKNLLQTRSANLLRLAKQRYKAYPSMHKLQFPEIMVGYPVPIDENEEVHLDNMNQITGFPVSKGCVKGPAKVVLSLDQVHTIEPGDILIASATDIGWSPYFPMLAGVVTEIGGLISHGAVVAREFGLPCIVGAQHATKLFQSGDIVLLDANNGIISKVI